MSKNMLSRRKFLAAGGAAALAVGTASLGAGEDDRIPCGFVGVGNRGTSLLRAILKVKGARVVAICDLDGEHRKRACDLVEGAGSGRPKEYENWNQLLERNDIPAVVSALPCYLHYPLYRDALAAGKHLYGEKPLCLTAAHANDLVKRVKAAGKVFQIGFQRRFSGQYRAAVEAYRSGIIGKPFEGRGARFGTGGPFRKPGEWFSFRARSGDWMLEQAVHHWDGLAWALEELPVSAYGTGHQDIFKDWDPRRDVSDYYSTILKYRSGLIFTWTHTWVTPPDTLFRGMYERLIGPGGGIDLSAGFVAFRKGHKSKDGKSTLQVAPEETRDITVLALTDFIDCVKTGRKPYVGVEDGRNATLMGRLVQKAVYEERTVTMEEILKEE